MNLEDLLGLDFSQDVQKLMLVASLNWVTLYRLYF